MKKIVLIGLFAFSFCLGANTDSLKEIFFQGCMTKSNDSLVCKLLSNLIVNELECDEETNVKVKECYKKHGIKSEICDLVKYEGDQQCKKRRF